MPTIEPGTNNTLSGRGGMPTHLNETPLGGGAIGPGVFLGNGELAVQECNNGACRTVIRDRNNQVIRELLLPNGEPLGGADKLRGGGGRVIANGPRGVADTHRAIEQDRSCIAIGDDGLAADVVYAAPLTIRLVDRTGLTHAEIPGQCSNNEDRPAFIRDGVLSSAEEGRGWRLHDVSDPATPRELPLARWPNPISYLVPVRDAQGALWVLERHDLFLTLRQPEWDRAYIVAYHDGTPDNIGELYGPDVRLLWGKFLVVWSGNVQEDTSGDQDQRAAFTVAELSAQRHITFADPLTPVDSTPIPDPGPDPPEPPNPPGAYDPIPGLLLVQKRQNAAAKLFARGQKELTKADAELDRVIRKLDEVTK